MILHYSKEGELIEIEILNVSQLLLEEMIKTLVQGYKSGETFLDKQFLISLFIPALLIVVLAYLSAEIVDRKEPLLKSVSLSLAISDRILEGVFEFHLQGLLFLQYC